MRVTPRAAPPRVHANFLVSRAAWRRSRESAEKKEQIRGSTLLRRAARESAARMFIF